MKKTIISFCLFSILLVTNILYASTFMYVTDQTGIKRYNMDTGQYLGVFAETSDVLQGIETGPDGNLYTAFNGVKRYNSMTGEYMGVFASHSSINNAVDLAFGPDGNLYVSSHLTSEIYRFNSTTGDFIDVFANNSGLLSGPTGLTFGPDNKLYVSSHWGHKILRYDIYTRQEEQIASVTSPHDIVFDANNFFYVTAYLDDTLYKYDINGVLQETFDSNGELDRPGGMEFYANGDLYIANKTTIMQLDGSGLNQFAPVDGEDIYARYVVFQTHNINAIPEPLSIILLFSGLLAVIKKYK